MLGPGSPGFTPLAMMARDVAIAVSPLAKFPLKRLSADRYGIDTQVPLSENPARVTVDVSATGMRSVVWVRC